MKFTKTISLLALQGLRILAKTILDGNPGMSKFSEQLLQDRFFHESDILVFNMLTKIDLITNRLSVLQITQIKVAGKVFARMNVRSFYRFTSENIQVGNAILYPNYFIISHHRHGLDV